MTVDQKIKAQEKVLVAARKATEKALTALDRAGKRLDQLWAWKKRIVK